jgi:hypothetical protein
MTRWFQSRRKARIFLRDSRDGEYRGLSDQPLQNYPAPGQPIDE